MKYTVQEKQVTKILKRDIAAFFLNDILLVAVGVYCSHNGNLQGGASFPVFRCGNLSVTTDER